MIATPLGHAGEMDAKGVLVAAQRGDSSAQAEIFDTYKHQVAARILKMTGDAASVDDLVQEVFISAFGALSSFRGDAQLDTWLYRITVNKVRNWWDAQRRRRRRESDTVMSRVDAPATPEEETEAGEHRRLLYDALAQLPWKLRESFVARAIENMTLQEASAFLGVPVSTVSYRTRKAEQLLCEALGLDPEAIG
jgi:RNA polymerase sigma-70 factor (ECF subfamily)